MNIAKILKQVGILKESFDSKGAIKKLESVKSANDDKKMLSIIRDIQASIKSKSTASIMVKKPVLRSLDELAEALIANDHNDAQIIFDLLKKELKIL